MSDGIYSALSGALAQERALSIVANNVANTDTDGYKADRPRFAEVVAKQPKAAVPPPSLRYVAIDRVDYDAQSGSIHHTGSSYDMALQGDGYFTVETPQGERYTRAGSFAVDGDGVMRTHAGNKVLGEAGPAKVHGVEITIPANTKEVQIMNDGTVNADGQAVGKLKLVRFASFDDVEKEGLTLMKPKQGVTPVVADGNLSVEQGYVESSNVNAVSGMNELIMASRSFDAFQKVIDSFRDLDERTARDVGGK